MDIGIAQSIWTLLVFVVFIGIVIWAYSDKQKAYFDEAAQLPLDDDDDNIGEDKNNG